MKQREKELLEYNTGENISQINPEKKKNKDLKTKEVRRSKRHLNIEKDNSHKGLSNLTNINTVPSLANLNNRTSQVNFSSLHDFSQNDYDILKKVDLSTGEESLQKNPNAFSTNFENFGKIAKNIDEVSNFPKTFGDKKRRYMSSFNYI